MQLHMWKHCKGGFSKRANLTGKNYLLRAENKLSSLGCKSACFFNLPYFSAYQWRSLGRIFGGKGCSQKKGGDKKGMARMSAEPSG